MIDIQLNNFDKLETLLSGVEKGNIAGHLHRVEWWLEVSTDYGAIAGRGHYGQLSKNFRVFQDKDKAESLVAELTKAAKLLGLLMYFRVSIKEEPYE